MGFQLTRQDIQFFCGRIAYEKGEAYFRERKIELVVCDDEFGVYQGIVHAKEDFTVTIQDEPRKELQVACTCPSLSSYDHYCQHIAGVLIFLYENKNRYQSPRSLEYRKQQDSPSRDAYVAKSVLDLFQVQAKQKKVALLGRSRFDTRETLDVEFHIKTIPYGYRQCMFGMEMKVGSKRLYIVQKIRDFLNSLMKGEMFVFSKHFTYDPKQHCFNAENEVLIKQLIQVYQNETMYRDTSHLQSSHHSSRNGDRYLLIPPVLWEQMLPNLLQAPSATLTQGEVTHDQVVKAEDSLPLHFELDQEESAQGQQYQLHVKGFEQLTVMEDYGHVLYGGKIYSLSSEHCSRLFKLKQLMETSANGIVRLLPEQMDPFMEHVVPGLMKLGDVQIAKKIADRILKTELRAKLFLDRVKDRLLAGLEFHYGQIVIDPLGEKKRTSAHILVRDTEKEQRILELLEQSLFTRTEGGFYLEDDEAEYDFLYHVMPELEKLVKVYATTSVKNRVYTNLAPPIIKVDMKERTNWLEVTFDFDGIPESEIRKVLQSVEEKRRYYSLPDGAFMPLEGEAFDELNHFLDEIGFREKDLDGSKLRLPLIQGMRFLDVKSSQTIQLGKSLRRLLENMRNPDNLDFPVPDGLGAVLRDYQVYGYQWMKTLAQYGFGGILADDMGLGKTLQSISFLVSVLPEIREQKRPAIVVAPASLMYNWRNELKKFAPQIKTLLADGSKEERLQAYSQMEATDVVITSYPLVRRDHDHFAQSVFHTLIMDEAQAFKNHATQTAQSVKKIQSSYRFALTGTPVENRLEELWSILDAVAPALFPSRRKFNELHPQVIAKRVRPFLLRRLKRDVLKELPEKIESMQTSELLPDQKKLYLSYLVELQQETLKHLQGKDFQKNRIKILAGLTRLRQLCCHPALFVEDYEGSSAKFEQLLETIEECQHAGKRILVFSQFTEMLGLIGRELTELGVSYFYLDGKTPASERVALCNRFNEGERDLFLISLKAGGTGLNLTGADTVILYDLWWNPAVEEQAADRAHRIGQKKIVQVIRLISQGTVEEKMHELQQKKKHLLDEVVQPGEEVMSALTEQEIREILMLA